MQSQLSRFFTKRIPVAGAPQPNNRHDDYASRKSAEINGTEHSSTSAAAPSEQQTSSISTSRDPCSTFHHRAEIDREAEVFGETHDVGNLCRCPCCSTGETKPYQPSDATSLEATRFETSNQDGSKKRTRSFCPDWYTQHPWLTLCSSKQKAFCFECVTAKQGGLITFSTKAEPAFITDGFKNWKKSKQRFAEHENSHCHIEAHKKLASLNDDSVVVQLSSQTKNAQCKRRELFKTELACIQFLSRQGLALRGHREEDGNLYQLMKAVALNSDGVDAWLRSKNYLSHDIVNEIVSLMGRDVLNDILKAVAEARWYSILADETRDCSNKEQLVVCIRWIDQSYQICEEPVGLVSLPKADADTITAVIKDVLLRCALPLSDCRGQGYDGASTMMGHLSGVATRLQREVPPALPVHCLAHCTNLALQDLARQAKVIRDGLDLAREVARLIKFSPKREFHFIENQLNAPSKGPSIKPICPTRWTVRTNCIDSILKNYSTLSQTLQEVNASTRDDNGVAAGGLVALMDNFSTFFGLQLALLVFAAAEQLSHTLQGKATTTQDAYVACKAVRDFYTSQRNAEMFDAFYARCVLEAADKTSAPVLPRYRKRPARLDDGSAPHQFSSPEEYFRQQYFEVLEIAEAGLARRFDHKEFHLVTSIESLLLDSANAVNHDTGIPRPIAEMYATDINISKLETQLKILPELVKSVDIGCPVKKVTNIRTLCEILNAEKIGPSLLGEVDKLIRLYLTIPVTTATAERTFSVLRRLKTYLRSTMTSERLNNLLLLHAHKDRTDKINLTEIARSFVQLNENRMTFFGNFNE